MENDVPVLKKKDTPPLRFGQHVMKQVEKSHQDTHLWDQKWLHFVDLGADLFNTMVQKTAMFLPWLKTTAKAAGKAVPVLGMGFELAHVYPCMERAWKDKENGHLSQKEFDVLTLLFYAPYVASGSLGLPAIPFKEGTVLAMQQFPELFNPRYVPHTLWQEFSHLMPKQGEHAAAAIHFHDAGKSSENCTICQSLLGTLTAPSLAGTRPPLALAKK